MRSLFTRSHESSLRDVVALTEEVGEFFSAAVLSRLITTYSCFADIGAGTGDYCQVALQSKSRIRVMAFESQPVKMTKLKQRLITSKHKTLFATKLERLIQHLPQGKRVFFRINAVGRELDVLGKIGKKLAKYPPLLIAFNPNEHTSGGTTPDLLLQRLLQLGYLVYFLNEVSFEYWLYEPNKSDNWHAFTELSGPCVLLCIDPAQKNFIKTIFTDLLQAKYLNSTNLTTVALLKQVKKTKQSLQQKIRHLSRKKHAADLLMSDITASVYFKIWQSISNLPRKLFK